MGTTIIFVWIIEDRAFLTWCGDSRGYIFNKETGLRRISNDHSFVQELVDAGKLDADLAFEHPNSNIVTRCLGDFSEKARPEFRSYTLQKGDYLLLCSDGLCGICRDEEIAQTMFEHSSKWLILLMIIREMLMENFLEKRLIATIRARIKK